MLGPWRISPQNLDFQTKNVNREAIARVAEAFVRCGGRGLHFRHKYAASLLFAHGACSSATSQAPLPAILLPACAASACGLVLLSTRPANRCGDDKSSD